MRIAEVSDFYLPRIGGIEMHVAGLAARQRVEGHHVDVVTATGEPGSPSGAGALLVATDRGGQLARMRPAVIAEAAAVVLNGNYDVVHVHAGVVTPLAVGVAASTSRAGLPTVVTVHSMLSRLHSAYRGIDLATQWTTWPVAWTAVSSLAAAPVQRLVGPDAVVSVLPNAIDVDAWRVDPLPRDPDDVVIVGVMRLAARKRPLDLLRALRRLRRELPERLRLSAIIAGDGPQRRSLERYLARHRMADWVTLPGWCTHEEIRAVFGRADVFIAPADLESFGIAALEARAAGLPVVAKARGGISEFIEHGRDGLLVDDDAGMVAALAALASDPRARGAMAAHNAAVAPPFGWPEALARTEIAYSRAAAIQGRRIPAFSSLVAAGAAMEAAR